MDVFVEEIPKGFRNKAQGCDVGATLGNRWSNSQPQRGCVSVPNISFIPFHSVFAQKRPQLVLERHLPVMLLLAGDAFFNLEKTR